MAMTSDREQSAVREALGFAAGVSPAVKRLRDEWALHGYDARQETVGGAGGGWDSLWRFVCHKMLAQGARTPWR